jgi:hypothetical protein
MFTVDTQPSKIRVVILGGGFSGVYTAIWNDFAATGRTSRSSW